jgi:putative GTP pyrophosphokinase
MNIPGFIIIEKEICNRITDELDKVGLLYRIFSRSKDSKSISEKIERKEKEGNPYEVGNKLIQDIIGVRIVTYFKDDVEFVKEILNEKIKFIDEEIDTPDPTVFKPKRTNIICSFTTNQKQTLEEIQKTSSTEKLSLVDSTFELQLRTILSEGWHEIDHSLRYKCKSDWNGQAENERLLNGIYASLEINDITLKNLFNDLSYTHFKNKNWEGLLRNKFRLKFKVEELKPELIEILNTNPKIGKDIFKMARNKVLMGIYKLDLSLPVSLNNLLFLINALYIKNNELTNVTPSVIGEYTE